jgi:hypothetical protein
MRRMLMARVEDPVTEGRWGRGSVMAGEGERGRERERERERERQRERL